MLILWLHSISRCSCTPTRAKPQMLPSDCRARRVPAQHRVPLCPGISWTAPRRRAHLLRSKAVAVARGGQGELRILDSSEGSRVARQERRNRILPSQNGEARQRALLGLVVLEIVVQNSQISRSL